ncbi:type II toxin-antitoxin system HipA family toxin [Salinarimonas chemoclinalis]|uniref:type II toxin-antitoxin system HipA family toxin n=1 Tax=Salinarimonas chemoclinalis TaxID=3241599 RepID=UPI003558B78B
MWRISDAGLVERLVVFRETSAGAVPVGELVAEGRGPRRQSRFRYARSYLARPDRRAVDPIGMPPSARSYPSAPEEVPLAFLDAGPDGWGKGILRQAYPDLDLGMMEMLALGGAERTGDLLFGPTPDGPETWRPATRALARLPDAEDDLEALLAAARAADEGDATADHLGLLFRSSRDVGGARPKARLRRDAREYIAKFPAWGDRFDEPRVEAACLDAAEAAGVPVAERVVLDVAGRSVLLVCRFDRDDAGRAHGYLSMATLLRQPSTEYRTDKTYVDMALVARRIGAASPEADMYRRLLVNAWLRNTDDHLRNHAMIDRGAGWELSPAFDIVPHPGVDRHACAPARGTSPACDPAAAAASHRAFGLVEARARDIHEEVMAGVRRFAEFLDGRGVRARDVAMLREAVPALRLDRAAPVP